MSNAARHQRYTSSSERGEGEKQVSLPALVVQAWLAGEQSRSA